MADELRAAGTDGEPWGWSPEGSPVAAGDGPRWALWDFWDRKWDPLPIDYTPPRVRAGWLVLVGLAAFVAGVVLGSLR